MSRDKPFADNLPADTHITVRRIFERLDSINRAGGFRSMRAISVEAFGEAGQDYLRTLKRRPTTKVALDYLKPIAKAMDCSVAFLQGETDDPARGPGGDLVSNLDPESKNSPTPGIASKSHTSSDVDTAIQSGKAPGTQAIPPASGVSAPFDLPVYGYGKAGAEGFFLDFATVQRLDQRPSYFLGNGEAYRLVIHGESLEPVARHGDYADVDPTRPARSGDDVVVQTEDGQVLIKRLKKQSDSEISVEQFNPPKTLKFKTAKLKQPPHFIRAFIRA